MAVRTCDKYLASYRVVSYHEGGGGSEVSDKVHIDRISFTAVLFVISTLRLYYRVIMLPPLKLTPYRIIRRRALFPTASRADPSPQGSRSTIIVFAAIFCALGRRRGAADGRRD